MQFLQNCAASCPVAAKPARANCVVVRAQTSESSRRNVMGLLAAGIATAVLSVPQQANATYRDEAKMLTVPVYEPAPWERAGRLVVEQAPLKDYSVGDSGMFGSARDRGMFGSAGDRGMFGSARDSDIIGDLCVEDLRFKCIRDDSILLQNKTQFRGYYSLVSYTPGVTMIKQLDAQLRAAIADKVTMETVLKLVFDFMKGDERMPQEGSVGSGKSIGVMVPTQQAYINAWVYVPTNLDDDDYDDDGEGKWQWLGQVYARHKTRVVITP